MHEIQIPLTVDEFALLQLAYQQLGHEHQTPEHFANATIQQLFIDLGTELTGSHQGKIMT